MFWLGLRASPGSFPFFCVTIGRIIFAEQDDLYVTPNIDLVAVQFKYVSQGLLYYWTDHEPSCGKFARYRQLFIVWWRSSTPPR